MNVPNFLNERVIDEKGFWTDSWRLVISQLLAQCQMNLSNQGFVLPPQTTAYISGLTNAKDGTLIYDTDAKKGKLKEDGTFKTIVTT